MFDKLRNAFSTAAKSIGQKEISEKVLDDTLLDLQIGLLESDVAQEVTDYLSNALKKELIGLRLEKGEEAEQVIQSKFRDAVTQIFVRAGNLDVLQKIASKKAEKNGAYTIVFLGINGTGKTTTVAKFANLLRKNGFSVVIAAGDTHRSGAIEQVTRHAENLSIKVIAQRYGADPSAVGRDAVDYAKKHYVDVVLVDTAGRMQTSKNLMDEMSKIVRVVKPDLKLFVGDALAGNDTINQAREFFQYTNFDGAILTKIDADAKGGAAISIAHITAKPILYVGTGQSYDNFVSFDSGKFVETLFGPNAMLTPKYPTPPAPSFPTQDIEQKRPPSIVRAVVTEQPRSESQQKPAEPLGELAANEKVNVEAKSVETSVPALTASETAERKTGEPNEEKKGRFGFFSRKGKDKEDKKKKTEPSPLSPLEEQEQPKDKRDKKRKEDKDTAEQKDKVIYLTDEDIEDLLK